MLKTAFKPKWILALLGAFALATIFVLLSGWQFGSSSSEPVVKVDTTEKPVPLTHHYQPGIELLGSKADQLVTFSGHFVPGTDVLISGRIDNGQRGQWVVSAFAVDGAPGKNDIAVARGWQPEGTSAVPAPSGKFTITGRLLPPEGPQLNHDVRNGTLASLSSAQLANTWNVNLYSGFISAHQIEQDGKAFSQAGVTPIYVGPQPQEAQVNWLNVFYGIEWVVFAGFAFFMWYRLVRDDYQRDMDQIAHEAALKVRGTLPTEAETTTSQSLNAQQKDESDEH